CRALDCSFHARRSACCAENERAPIVKTLLARAAQRTGARRRRGGRSCLPRQGAVRGACRDGLAAANPAWHSESDGIARAVRITCADSREGETRDRLRSGGPPNSTILLLRLTALLPARWAAPPSDRDATPILQG